MESGIAVQNAPDLGNTVHFERVDLPQIRECGLHREAGARCVDLLTLGSGGHTDEYF